MRWDIRRSSNIAVKACLIGNGLLLSQLTFEPYTEMSDLITSIVNDVVINDITSAMMTRPHVIHAMPNNLEWIA